MTVTLYGAGAIAIANATGSEKVTVDNGGSVEVTLTTQQIANLASLSSTNDAITALNTVSNGTITGAGIVGGVTARGGAQSATPFTDTTDTAANIIAALPSSAPVGTTFYWKYENTTNANATLMNGLNVTLSGNLIVPLLTWATYLVKVATAATITMTFVGGGALVPLPYTQQSNSNSNGVSIGVATVTGAQICNVVLTASPGPGTLTTGTAARIIAAIPNAKVGLSYMVQVRNLGNAVGHLIGGVSVTVTGGTTIGLNTSTLFNVQIGVPTNTHVTFTNMGGSAT